MISLPEAPRAGRWAPMFVSAALPTGAKAVNKNGTACCLNGNTGFRPAYGADGVCCTVVPAP